MGGAQGRNTLGSLGCAGRNYLARVVATRANGRLADVVYGSPDEIAEDVRRALGSTPVFDALSGEGLGGNDDALGQPCVVPCVEVVGVVVPGDVEGRKEGVSRRIGTGERVGGGDGTMACAGWRRVEGADLRTEGNTRGASSSWQTPGKTREGSVEAGGHLRVKRADQGCQLG